MPILPPSFTPPQTYSPFTSLEITPVQSGRPRVAAPAGSATAANGSSATIAASAAYNFGWTVTGADQAKPVQVFDDGSKVFVQFIDMKHIPAIFAETPTGRVLLRWDLQFPYAVIARPEQTLIFQSGTYEARASRTPGAAQSSASAASRDTTPAAAASPLSAPTSRAPQPARPATTDALWYVGNPTTSKPQQSTSQPAPLQTATEQPSAPPVTAPAQKAKPAPSTDALWYINAK